ncbi:MAG: glucosyl-3-phosphoglycerate synthase [Nocardiopsaceae bacterium]|nr:glucosyl-3-phosphoglycerate synthase [Nocardiopsaceae bacterium]
MAADWFRRRTSRWQDWPVDDLAARKKQQGLSVSVVIPARDEERTISGVVSAISQLKADTGLVDELVVIDSDSTDATARSAKAAGAVVHAARDIAPELGAYPGKGEALWKSLLVTKGDLVVFIDADLTRWGPHFVTGLLGPLLADPGIQLVKGFYERLFSRTPGGSSDAGADDDGSVSADGGRVTELVARPLLSLWWPELTSVVQPLAGEWAARRELMESLPIPVGYGIEIAVLLDTARDRGLDAIAQVDLGRRGHKHQSSHDLALMATELMLVAERRRLPLEAQPLEAQPLEAQPREAQPREALTLRQFTRHDGQMRPRVRPVPATERPPARSVVRRQRPA